MLASDPMFHRLDLVLLISNVIWVHLLGIVLAVDLYARIFRRDQLRPVSWVIWLLWAAWITHVAWVIGFVAYGT